MKNLRKKWSRAFNIMCEVTLTHYILWFEEAFARSARFSMPYLLEKMKCALNHVYELDAPM
jgi:hypothetical protein